MVHNTVLNSSDNLHSYPPDNHHSSDDIYWRRGGWITRRRWRCSQVVEYLQLSLKFPLSRLIFGDGQQLSISDHRQPRVT